MTDLSTNRRPTNQQTEIRVHREITHPIMNSSWFFNYRFDPVSLFALKIFVIKMSTKTATEEVDFYWKCNFPLNTNVQRLVRHGLSGICTSMLLPGHTFHIDATHLKITNISFLHKQSIIIWPEPRSFGRYTNYFRSHAPNPTPLKENQQISPSRAKNGVCVLNKVKNGPKRP